MLRVCQILSDPLDADAMEAARMVGSLATAVVDRRRLQVRANLWSTVRGVLDLLRAPDFDVVHAVGEPALDAALNGSDRPIVFTPTVHRRGAYHRAVKLDQLPMRVTLSSIPPIATCRVRRDRAALREAMGVSENDMIIYAPGATTDWSGHKIAIWVASVLHYLDPRYRLLVSGFGRGFDGIARFAQRSTLDRLLICGRGFDWTDLAVASDCAIVTPSGAIEELPLIECVQERRPVFAFASPHLPAWLDESGPHIMQPAKPRLLAQAIREWSEQGGLPNAKAVDPWLQANFDYDRVRDAWSELLHRTAHYPTRADLSRAM